MKRCRLYKSLFIGLLLSCFINTHLLADSLNDTINSLAKGGFKERAKVIGLMSRLNDDRILNSLEALSAGKLYFRKNNKQVIILKKEDNKYYAKDPVTKSNLGVVQKKQFKKIRVNNRLRRQIKLTLSSLKLRASRPKDRILAATNILKTIDKSALKAIQSQLLIEKNKSVRKAMIAARASVILFNNSSNAKQIQSINILMEYGGREARSVLTRFLSSANPQVKKITENAIKTIDVSLQRWTFIQNVWYGLSLGSVLLLAAIGLAITFGVMGVINMAHGEMVMIGAYTTFVVQDLIKANFSHLFEYSLAFSIPLAFIVSGLVGIAIERGVIRYLYGRPLETLLATWGISLVLQQTVRSLFGPTNQEVSSPEFMSGAFQVGQMTITYNRLYIIFFAVFILLILLILIKKSSFGLQMRAVTQNRLMARSMGIRSDWVDALTFGLGSGIAGIAGVALSQIENVSPNLGQAYIIDSFMVVVFGGVGNLWGTLVGAMTLGVANKFLEPFAGAVLAKIMVLIFIILFIQKRPRGMFALKGRAIE